MNLSVFFKRPDIRLLIRVADAAKEQGDQKTVVSAIDLMHELCEQAEFQTFPVPEMSVEEIFAILRTKCKIENYLNEVSGLSHSDCLTSVKLVRTIFKSDISVIDNDNRRIRLAFTTPS